MTKQLLSAHEAQSEFNYSRSTLLRFEEQGILHPVRPGGTGQRRYPREQLQSLATPVAKLAPTSTGINPAKPDYRELGTTGMRLAGGSLVEERLRELQGREGRILLRQIRQNDPIIFATFFALTASLRQAGTRIKPASEGKADVECAQWIDRQLNDMLFSWNDTKTLIIEPMFEQGFSTLELCYKKCRGEEPGTYADPLTGHTVSLPPSKYNDGRIAWHKLASRPAESLTPGAEWIVDANGDVLGINQSPEYFGNFSPPLTNENQFPHLNREDAPGVHSIPIQKLLHFRTTIHPANTPEGLPIHRAAYLPWYYTTNLQEIEGIGAERDLGGIPVIYMGRDLTLGDDPNSDYQLATKLVTNVRVDEQMGIVFPGPKMGMAGEGNGWLFELAATTGSRQWDISSIIERYDKRKALVVLAQFLLLGMEQVGSFALSQSHGDLFVLAAKSWLISIADIINRQAIQRLVRFNAFPGITGYPELVFSDVGIPDLVTISSYVNSLVDKEVLKPDAELERHLRHIANLPPPPPVEIRGRAASGAFGGEVGGQEVTDEAAPENLESTKGLNGGQMTSALEIVAQVSQDIIAEKVAIELLTLLGLDRETAEFIVSESKKGPVMTLPGQSGSQFQAKKKVISKAERNPKLTPQGKKALALTEALEADIQQEWADMMAKVAEGKPIKEALSQYENNALALISAGMSAAWLVAQKGPISPAEQKEIDKALEIQREYLEDFMAELGRKLAETEEENRGGLLLANAARVTLYGGAIWGVFNTSKVWGAEPDALFEWVGVGDDLSCSGCLKEMVKEPRKLKEFKVWPGENECLGNCRCEIIQVQ